MSQRTDWHFTANLNIYCGYALAFAAGARVPDDFVYRYVVPLSAVTFDQDAPTDEFTDTFYANF